MRPEPAPAATGSSHGDDPEGDGSCVPTGPMPCLLLPGDGLLLISTDLKLLHVDRTASQSLGMAPSPRATPLWRWAVSWARSPEGSGRSEHHHEACV